LAVEFDVTSSNPKAITGSYVESDVFGRIIVSLVQVIDSSMLTNNRKSDIHSSGTSCSS